MTDASRIATVAVQVENLPVVQRTLAEANAEIEHLRAQVAERDATIAQLRAQLDAVPVAQLRRQYSVEPMTVHDFGLDAQDVDAWLRSLDGDA